MVVYFHSLVSLPGERIVLENIEIMKWLLKSLIIFVLTKGVWNWEWYWNTVDRLLGERCTHRWLNSDVEGLRNDFTKKVFGQPFLEQALLPLVKRHLGVGMPENYVSKKALAVSFHGSPGVGKTYVSQLIAKHLFKEGEKSAYYKHVSLGSSLSFTPEKLKEMVIDTVIKCDRAVFVFDEIEKMPEGTFEVLKSFLDFHTSIGNVDYRKSIFIFISNVGMDQINSLALSLWKQGLKREEYKLSDFEKVLQETSYNEKSGLQKTKIVKNFLIDMYLPFLPLEKRHVEKCISTEAESLRLHVTPHTKETILRSMIFLPPEEKIYSASGCKPVSSLIKIHAHDEL